MFTKTIDYRYGDKGSELIEVTKYRLFGLLLMTAEQTLRA